MGKKSSLLYDGSCMKAPMDQPVMVITHPGAGLHLAGWSFTIVLVINIVNMTEGMECKALDNGFLA